MYNNAKYIVVHTKIYYDALYLIEVKLGTKELIYISKNVVL